MNLIVHDENGIKITEVVSGETVISSLQDALDLMADISYRGMNKIIIREEQIAADFFDLRSGLAGEILQKCVNYGIKLAIAGEFDKYESKSLKAFIIECNRGNQFFFVPDITGAKARLVKV